MKTILMLAAASAVGAVVMAASAANAATSGVNGCYVMLPNQVIVTCRNAGPSAAGERLGAMNSSGTSQSAAPLYTGSIRTARTASARGHMEMVDSPQKCRPGAFWILANPNDNIPMACPSS